MTKTKDLFLNIVANPNMTLEDLASVGLTSENTMLLDRAQYASNEKVQNMFRDGDGNFDENKFNEWYNIAEQSYNILANDEANLNLMNVTAYDSDNIFVDPSKRTKENKPFVLKLPNPDRLNVGLTRIGKVGPRTLSQDEIAQTQQVLLNPTGVANGEAPKYGKSPNESWFEDFWDTKVMAAWDEDGIHIDPVTGKEVQHQKGDLKLNENGTYYYESLDGRSVYGKRILNKFNTLTTDGSALNKYDFFDSDDIEQKSIGGSIAKNLALVGSMFIPYVGWGVAAASVVHQTAGLFATFGKMLAGADNPTLNAVEGWVKSTDRRNLKTEYAQQNMWCWENFIDLIGDTTAQLREQRAIFKFAPALIKGDFKALSDKAMDDYAKKLAKEGLENATNLKFRDLVKLAHKQNPVNAGKQLDNLIAGAKDIYTAKAQKAVRDYLKSYYKLGEPIAKAYMTAITVQDTFGEAIEAGATNGEATLLTLGYAAAEAALLSTDLGKWIMPELRSERQRYKMIAQKLLEVPEETRALSKQISRLADETKKDWAKRLFNIGKDICRAEYSTMAKTVGSVLAQGLGEGIEEVSEEALADFSKSCFNLVQQLQGDDVRMHAWNHNWDWSEAANRYGMSFAGGILGGGINAAASDYKGYRELAGMTSQQALQQLVYMTRNDELNDFWKVIDKTQLASKELSTEINDNGVGYKQGTKDNNQDLEAKNFLRYTVKTIESIINAENAKLDDNGLLSILTQVDPSIKNLDPVKEYRMRALANSSTAGRFLNEWNTITSDIVKNRLAQQQIISKYKDESSEKYSEEDKQELKRLGKDLKELQKRKDAIRNGERTREFVRDSLFEMTHAVNEIFDDWGTEVRFIESQTGKKYKDVSEDEKKKLKEQYEQLKSSNQYAEKVHALAEIYETMARVSSNGIQQSAEYYESMRQQNNQLVNQLDKLANKRLVKLIEVLDDPDKGISTLQAILSDEFAEDLRFFDGTSALQSKISEIEAKVNLDIQNLVGTRTEQELTESEKTAIDNFKKRGIRKSKEAVYKSVFGKINSSVDSFIKLGFIHPETRHMLEQMLNSMSKYAGMLQDIYGVDDDLDAKYKGEQDQLYSKIDQLRELPNTPIVENLRQFQLATDTDKTAVDLIQELIVREQKEHSDISALQFDKFTLEQFKDTRKLLEMYRSAIVGARYDHVDIDSIVGFNTTLNEVMGAKGTVKLAEIDAQTADLVLEDINKLLNRLDYMESIHKLNSGNKYNIQHKTAINKNFILFNKINQLISTIQDDKDKEWQDKDGENELAQLVLAMNRASTLASNTGKTYNDRTFTLDPTQKVAIENEMLDIQNALHNYLKKHIDGSQASIDKLAKLLSYDNFKGLIRENNEFLESTSNDMDDSAFIWWLAATAVLNPDQFYNNYRQIIGQEKEGERPIAPIPTQELGVFALTAAIVNGDVFKHFGKALRQSLSNTWEKDAATRDKIRKDYGSSILKENESKFFKNADFLPNFDNILFIEGIAGSGKTKGVMVTLSKLLAKTNPEFVQSKIFIAHTNKTKADNLGKATEFSNYEAHDHDSLLSFMSPDYKHQEQVNGVTQYVMDKDVYLQDGILRSKWELREYNQEDIPKLIVIDEWSHYNQLEQELIQRFAQKYGITVVTMGDYDQLTPKAMLMDKEGEGAEELLQLTPNRNMTARIAKLGVSMRTDNEVKNTNMNNMLAWKLNPTQVVNLHYYEDETGIYGDKAYSVSGTNFGDTLDKIKIDVKKMISTLKSGEKIGYIFHKEKSDLYKWLTTTEGIKEHIIPYSEKDAHGEEAQYYVVENNRDGSQDSLNYFESLYTGITRSEQGSIVITNNGAIKKELNDKYNKAGITIKVIQDSEMILNTFTDEGTRDFSNKRKKIFDDRYGTRETIPFEIKPRTRENIIISRDDFSIPSSVIEGPEVAPKPNTEEETIVETTSNTPDVELPKPSEISPERTETPLPEEPSYEGPLKKGQSIYNINGDYYYNIEGEDLTDPEHPKYIVKDVRTGTLEKFDKDYIHNQWFTKLPTESKLFNVNDKIISSDNKIHSLYRVTLEGSINNPEWVYDFGDFKFTHQELKKNITDGTIKTYVEPANNEDLPVIAEEIGNQQEYEEIIDENFELTEQIPESISQNKSDINFKLLGFTFNTNYLADEFDDTENIIIDPESDRIDNGYGLYKINKQRYSSKAQIKKDLGSIRRHLQFSENADIINHLKNLFGRSIQGELSIRWAFISKSEETQSQKYNRFTYPKSELEYMGKKDEDIPRKTLSAIIYDKYGNAILEIPMVVLQSPHSIFIEMRNKGIGQDITNLWKFDKKNNKETLQCLTNIHNHIQKNHASDPGYKSLGDLIKLWLFTNNGFKLLPDNWNLHNNTNNLGNFYIINRISDNETYNFKGDWVNLEDVQRSDRFISDIMMNNSEQYMPKNSNKIIKIFRPYTPYVLISDDPKINNNELAAKRYLAQQSDPTLEKTVKLIPVVPPQTSVTSYIESMYDIIHGRVKYAPYGKYNKYPSYRILDAILKSPNANKIMSELGADTKNFITEWVGKLNKVKNDNPIKDGETKLQYKKRLASLQNKLLNTFIAEGKHHGPVYEKLRSALVSMCMFESPVSGETKRTDILQMIEEACKQENITGILCKPQFDNDQKGQEIGGFAYKIKTENKYRFPGNGSFRIFGKIDTPTYDLSSILPEIEKWAKDATLGAYVDPKTGKKVIKPDNVWSFINDDAYNYYLPKNHKPKINAKTIIGKLNSLLARLNINEQNIDISELESCNTEAEALQKATDLINKKYLETDGAFIITDINGNFKYGSIFSENTPEFKNYKYKSIQSISGGYVITFMNLENNMEEQIEIGLDSKENMFLVKPKIQEITSTPSILNVGELKQEIQNKFNNSLLSNKPKYVSFMEKVLSYFNEETNTVDVDKINFELVNSGIDNPIVNKQITRLLQLDRLKNLEEEQKQDLCINPIKIRFK